MWDLIADAALILAAGALLWLVTDVLVFLHRARVLARQRRREVDDIVRFVQEQLREDMRARGRPESYDRRT